jgi:hypothetical protein
VVIVGGSRRDPNPVADSSPSTAYVYVPTSGAVTVVGDAAGFDDPAARTADGAFGALVAGVALDGAAFATGATAVVGGAAERSGVYGSGRPPSEAAAKRPPRENDGAWWARTPSW